MRDPDDLFDALSRSAFRRKQTLRPPDLAYLRGRGMETVLRHADEMIAARLAPAEPPNDGKQTPMRGHPVFVAQHATGTCCRGCLAKWHRIPRGRELTRDERAYVVRVLERWMRETATVSITIMEIVDNAIMLLIPGAMDSGLDDVLFWGALSFALVIAGAFALPLNRWLLAREKGHAVVHETGIHGGLSPRTVGIAAAIAFVFGTSVLAAEVLVGSDEPAHDNGGGHTSLVLPASPSSDG